MVENRFFRKTFARGSGAKSSGSAQAVLARRGTPMRHGSTKSTGSIRSNKSNKSASARETTRAHSSDSNLNAENLAKHSASMDEAEV